MPLCSSSDGEVYVGWLLRRITVTHEVVVRPRSLDASSFALPPSLRTRRCLHRLFLYTLCKNSRRHTCSSIFFFPSFLLHSLSCRFCRLPLVITIFIHSASQPCSLQRMSAIVFPMIFAYDFRWEGL